MLSEKEIADIEYVILEPKTYDSDPCLKFTNSLDRNDRNRVCGICKWKRREDGEWTCGNEDSEMYSDYTAYSDTCAEWEGR